MRSILTAGPNFRDHLCKPKMLVAIALANKMARQIWAMLTKNEDYKDPALAVAA